MTIGVAGGSSVFSGVIQDDGINALALVKAGTGTIDSRARKPESGRHQ